LKNKTNEYILHCKGIPTKLLKWDDFVELYHKNYFIYKKVGFLAHVTNHIKLIENMDKKVEVLDNKRHYFGDDSKPLKNINDFYEILKK
jgi:chaperonin cofactor prefoldin